ncbi:ABC transporter substrate-binding protein [Thiomicrorhabdus aquaedulcis]|uniref:ABC transporter substrate-binding protein n=1 Tax=Thiomicrorhabdus aquaedulcis TaxID=2211106 RepID=UPI000FD98780|nr:ABC transporter substrate-binding protein [Thiomicrorhabdus aquaedulcis]
MLTAFLKHHQLSPKDLKLVPLATPNHLNAWQTQDLDYLITYDPIAQKILPANAHIVFDSRQIPDLIIDVLAVRTPLCHERPQTIKRLTQAHFAGLELIKRDFQESSYQIADNLGLTQAQIVQALADITLPSKEINHKMLANDFDQNTQTISQILYQAGLIKTLTQQKIHTDTCL